MHIFNQSLPMQIFSQKAFNGEGGRLNELNHLYQYPLFHMLFFTEITKTISQFKQNLFKLMYFTLLEYNILNSPLLSSKIQLICKLWIKNKAQHPYELHQFFFYHHTRIYTIPVLKHKANIDDVIAKPQI